MCVCVCECACERVCVCGHCEETIMHLLSDVRTTLCLYIK